MKAGWLRTSVMQKVAFKLLGGALALTVAVYVLTTVSGGGNRELYTLKGFLFIYALMLGVLGIGAVFNFLTGDD